MEGNDLYTHYDDQCPSKAFWVVVVEPVQAA
jgi:hypothetical protein